MKIEEKTNDVEKQVLIGLVVDRKVLSMIYAKKDKQLFESRYANLVAEWCFSYFAKYDEAPKNNIKKLYEDWAKTSKEKTTISIIEEFLSSLSDEYEKTGGKINSDFVLDVAAKYLNEIKIKKLIDSLETDIDGGSVNKAVSKINKFSKIEIGNEASINVLQDKEAIRAAFEDRQEALITYSGDVGDFFGKELCRDGFIGFMGPEKRGKSTILMELARVSAMQRKKVAFFEVGDMSRNQVLSRFMMMFCKTPRYAKKDVKIPYKIINKEEQDSPDVKYKTKTFEKGLSWQKAYKKCQEIMECKIKSEQPYLKLSCHPASTLTVSGMKNILDDWQRMYQWTPDVIVIDYADLLASDQPEFSRRDQINDIWEKLRAVSQIYHCLLITATQSDANSYDVKTIKKSNFSEDKRKLAHVTGMVGLNQTEEEKHKGLMRLNWIVLRENEFIESKCVYIAGNFSIGRPIIVSSY